jgi:RNA polymerase sigma factor (sigma-70 family)
MDALADHAEAIEEFVALARPRVKGLLRYYRVPPEDAEDLLQDAFLALLLKWPDIRLPEVYFVGIVRRKCASYIAEQYDRRQVAQVDPAVLTALAGAAPAPRDDFDHRLDLAVLAEDLSVSQNRVLALRWLGLNFREIGFVLGRHTDTVRKDAARTVARLQLGAALCD